MILDINFLVTFPFIRVDILPENLENLEFENVGKNFEQKYEITWNFL